MTAHSILDTLSDSSVAPWSGGVILLLAVAGIVGMALSSGQQGSERKASLLLLVLGALYAAVHAGVFVVVFSRDRYAIFEDGYLLATCVGLPALAVVPVLLVGSAGKRVTGSARIGFSLFVIALAAAHLWVVAQASASV